MKSARLIGAGLVLVLAAGGVHAQTRQFTSNQTFQRGNVDIEPLYGSIPTAANVSWGRDTYNVTTPNYTPVSAFFAGVREAGRFGLDLSGGIKGGRWSASIPTSITYTAPQTIRPGERVTLTSSRTIGEGFRFDSTGLSLEASLDFVFRAHNAFGAGADAPFSDPWNTGAQEASIPNRAPMHLLDRHRNDVTFVSTRDMPNGEFRKQLVRVGTGSTQASVTIPGLRGVLAVVGSPANLPGNINGGTRQGDVITGSARSSSPIIGAEVNLSNLWNALAPLGGLPPVGFVFPDPDAKFNISAYLVDGRLRAGAYWNQRMSLDMAAPDAIMVTYRDQNGALLGSAPLGAPFSFNAPQNLAGFEVRAQAAMNNVRMVNQFGVSAGVDFQLSMLTGSVNVAGLNVFDIGPMVTATVNLAESPVAWLPVQPTNVTGDASRWGTASQVITFEVIPAPGAAALLGAGLLVLGRRRRP
jgi:uncharacterized protein (TIGR03382 family)